jgi:hypothetical protein
MSSEIVLTISFLVTLVLSSNWLATGHWWQMLANAGESLQV